MHSGTSTAIWAGRRYSTSDDFAVFELRGALLALFPVDKLASDARAEPATGGGGIRFAIIITMDRPEQVDELADRVRQAGGTLTKEPVDAEFFTGRDAYFADPEGNYWEIAWRPRTTRCPPQPAALPASRPETPPARDRRREVTEVAEPTRWGTCRYLRSSGSGSPGAAILPEWHDEIIRGRLNRLATTPSGESHTAMTLFGNSVITRFRLP